MSAPVAARPHPAVVAAALVHAVILLVVGGIVGMFALLPIAMAADSCTSATTALLCTGLPQLVAVVVLGLGILGAAVVAALGARRGGWGALGYAVGGWLTLAAGLVVAGGALWLGT